MPVQVAKYSLALPMIEVGIEHETTNTSIVTSSKLYEFPCANCDYMAAPNFFTSSESEILYYGSLGYSWYFFFW